MDIKKLKIPPLTGPNWGSYEISIQSAARILDIWDALKGELKGMTPQTYNLLKNLTKMIIPMKRNVQLQLQYGQKRTPQHWALFKVPAMVSLVSFGQPWRQDLGKQEEHRLTSRWLTWLPSKWPILKTCLVKFRNSKRITLIFSQMVIQNFLKISSCSHSVPSYEETTTILHPNRGSFASDILGYNICRDWPGSSGDWMNWVALLVFRC